MFFRAGARRKMAGVRAGAARLWRDRRAVAAVEFAFIAPVLLAMYFVTMEVSQAIETSKKVSRIGSMVADLVTQQQSSTTTADLDAIMKIGESTLLPYHRSVPTITITAIKLSNTATPKATVVWSRKMVGGTFKADAIKDATTTVPTSLKIRNTFLVRVESALDYKPVITWAADNKQRLGLVSAFASISMGETYYLRPRMSPEISCTDCYKK